MDDVYDYTSVNDYLAIYPSKKVRHAIGWNLRTFKFSEPHPVIELDCEPDANPSLVLLYPSNDNMSLFIDLETYFSGITQSLAIINNSTPRTDDFVITEKMSEQQFFYAINIIKKSFVENETFTKTLNSLIPMLESQLKKDYFPVEVYDDEIILPQADGIGYIVNLSKKTIVRADQSLDKVNETIVETLERQQLADIQEFENISKILKKELDVQNLKRFLNVENRIRSKVKFNSILKKIENKIKKEK